MDPTLTQSFGSTRHDEFNFFVGLLLKSCSEFFETVD
jgi:hypothetical protein